MGGIYLKKSEEEERAMLKKGKAERRRIFGDYAVLLGIGGGALAALSGALPIAIVEALEEIQAFIVYFM